MPDNKEPFAVSRRVVIGAASAAPVVAGAGGATVPDAAVARCAEWLALDAEIDRLGLRWSDLETILVRQKRWERMAPEERGELLPSEEMDAIDAQLKPLFDQREAWLEALPTVRAATSTASPPSWKWRYKSWSISRATGTTSSRRRWTSCAPRAVPIAGRPFASASRATHGNRLSLPNLREPGPERSVLALERLESLCRAGWCGSRAASPSLRETPEGRPLDARQPVRPSFHQAHQGGLSPSEGLRRSAMGSRRQLVGRPAP